METKNKNENKDLHVKCYLEQEKDTFKERYTWRFDENETLEGDVTLKDNDFFEGTLEASEDKKYLAFGILHEGNVAFLVALPIASKNRQSAITFSGVKNNLGYNGIFSALSEDDEIPIGYSLITFSKRVKDHDLEEVDPETIKSGKRLYLESVIMQDLLSKMISAPEKSYNQISLLALLSEAKEMVKVNMELKNSSHCDVNPK